MHTSYLIPAAMALLHVTSALPQYWSPPNSTCQPPTCTLTEAQSQAITAAYLHIWNTGNFSTVPSVLAPNVVYYQDRISDANGTGGSHALQITNSTAWEAFVTEARRGWLSYSFQLLYQFYQDEHIALRWLATEVSNHTGTGRNLPVGTAVQFNGTDLLTVNCDGLIVEVDSAQNTLQEFDQLKINLGVV